MGSVAGVAPSSPTVPLTRPGLERPPRRARRRTRAVAGLAVAAAGAGAVALLYAVAVLDATGRWVDDGLMRAAMSAGAGVRAEILAALDVGAPAVLLAVGMLVIGAWRRRRRGRAVAAATIVLGSQLLTQALKTGLPAVYGEGNSLPSGHVTVVAAAVVALAVLVPRSARVLRVLAVPVVGASGLATMIVGWHRPSDVLAAVAVIVTVGGLTAAAAALPGPRAASPRAM